MKKIFSLFLACSQKIKVKKSTQLLMLIFFLILFSTLETPLAEEIQMRSVTGGMIPNTFIDLGSEGEHTIIVEKSSQKLFIYDNKYNLVKTIIVTTGEKEGDKLQEGDRKTPEGVYFFTDIKKEEELPEKYGVMALTTNYPNLIDVTRKKKGDGIWLHATNLPSRPIVPFDTRGCIVTFNEEILEIARYVYLERTPLVIVEDIDYTPLHQLRTEQENIRALLNGWKEAWEGKDIERYINSYSDGFHTKGMDLRGWKRYKEGLNATYKNIDVSMKDIKILRFNDYMVATFIQDYRSDLYHDSGLKRLYLTKGENKWQIAGEEWKEIPPEKQKTLRIAELLNPEGS